MKKILLAPVALFIFLSQCAPSHQDKVKSPVINTPAIHQIFLKHGSIYGCYSVFEGFEGQIICYTERPTAYMIDEFDLNRTFGDVVAKEISDQYARYVEHKRLLEFKIEPVEWEYPGGGAFYLSWSYDPVVEVYGKSDLERKLERFLDVQTEALQRESDDRGRYSREVEEQLERYLDLKSRELRQDLYGTPPWRKWR